MSLPVDHFDSSNKDTYPNRYFVNDTYYKPGGPVILYDFGEGGVSASDAADSIAESTATSAPVRLAAKTNGLVIGWEHRYYGYSRPVPLNDTSGLPVAGADGYKYLTVEQALADAAFFANNFNTTTLRLNTNIQSTASLDPYHTPWIFMGGSYPGLRAAWARNQYPEIFYASWASSAPSQTQEDGSIYYNPVVRSMAQNCTKDIEAAIAYVDQTLQFGSATGIQQVKTGIFMAGGNAADLNDLSPALELSDFVITRMLIYAVSFGSFFQSFGPFNSSRILCDSMESFDVKNFTGPSTGFRNQSMTIQGQNAALYYNPGGVTPTDGGIAANNGQNGGAYAFAALLYGMLQAKTSINAFQQTLPGGASPISEAVDEKSWLWQSLNQLGFFQGSNPDHITVISKFYNFTAVEDINFKQGYFRDLPLSSLPSTFNSSESLARGGWNLNASNVMFTNGEFDPWRAFSVASQEDASPKRNIVQAVPKCNTIPEANNAFGLVYAGAVHAEDMSMSINPSRQGSMAAKAPLEQGLELFMSAWDAWLPCFNKSRDDVRNGRGVDGSGHAANGTMLKANNGLLSTSVSTFSTSVLAAVAVAFATL
jgi:hypothetical protein